MQYLYRGGSVAFSFTLPMLDFEYESFSWNKLHNEKQNNIKNVL